MRIGEDNFPAIKWVSENISIIKHIENIDSCLPQLAGIDQVVGDILKIAKVEYGYLTKTIIDIIDYDDKNIKTLGSLIPQSHGEPKVGLLSWGRCYSVLYFICDSEDYKNMPDFTKTDAFEIKYEEMKKTLNPTKFFITISFAGTTFGKSECAFVCGSTNDGGTIYSSFMPNLNWLCNQSYVGPKPEPFDMFELVDSFLVFKKYADVDEKILKKKSGETFINCKYSNSTNKNIRIYDSTFFTTLIKSSKFGVKGHFRWQPYGEGLSKKKLIWINDFKKEGYTRVAGKLKES